ncbi:Mechanosensitive ion channel protein 8 [Parachaetomium inaequale]|uniref:Mechanosensitive ion channel protein 8 n=1 Tax=Parachaetomium inaequale TaxID=2588326 RepID=A0AAN6SQM0_9PEZI|nr:Mechanosensitive ion channel protein 8 [Parachaetomium inaequale]
MDPGQQHSDALGNAPLLNELKADPYSTTSQTQQQGPGRTDYRTANGRYRSYLLRSLYGPLKFVLVFGVISVLLAIPVMVINDDEVTAKAELGDIDAFMAQQTRQVVYYIFGWLLLSWLGLAVCFALGTILPYVNPAHMRYWRILRTLRRPICIVGLVTFSYIGFVALIYLNRDNLAVSYDVPPDELGWIDIIEDFLQQGTLWAWFYFAEKMGILYITIHYHSRSDLGRIARSKDMQNALIALYEASTYLYPVGAAEFTEEDMMIGNATGQEHGEYRIRATRYLSRLGIDTYDLTSFFGNFLSSDPDSHWLRPASTYAVVERAIANPKSAEALGRRIWMSLVPVGKETLTAQDIAEVLGPFRKEEAEGYFKTLDEGELGDIRLDEMEWTVAEAGRIRHNIYKGMHAADHCINTFDWVVLASLAGVMVYFILVFWVPALKDIQETIKILGFGLAFAIGRTLHHFLAGCIFILFDHPYDIGDRIELWSGQQANHSISLIVVRTSLLYTVFKRVDNWMELQAGNEFLQQCRIENVSRSGANRQAVAMTTDINTSFRDLQFLRGELEAFVKHPENKRDYMPTLALAITGVAELNKLELRCIFTHRSNWSSEPLRAARSMKFMCALVAAIRKVPLNRPDGATLGKAFNPAHYVMLSPDDAAKKAEETKAEEAGRRWDAKEKQAGYEPVIDLAGVGREAGVSDEEVVRRAVEEAETKRREEAEREAAELAARLSLAKMPAVPRKGPPPRGEVGGGLTTGFQLLGDSGSGGLRSLPHFKG